MSLAVTLVLAAAIALPASALAAPRLGSRVLRPGMSGPDVRALQRELTRVGLRTPAVGRFGPATERNVLRFERAHHLTADGVASRALVLRLSRAVSTRTATADSGTGGSSIGSAGSSSDKPTHPRATRHSASPSISDNPSATVKSDGGSRHLGERTLHQGMHGHDVRVLQGYLTLSGFATGVDGSFGAGTKDNVIKFQQAHGLTADGVVTYAVSLVIRQAVAQALAGGAVGNATINSDGTAAAPSGAPAVVQSVITAANQIIDKPYIYAGGHSRWKDNGYDCSGSVSYALHGAGLLSAPEDSTGLESYGSPGPGRWITIYADASHTWIVVAGRAFDTANFGGPNNPGGSGPRWRSDPTGNLADGGNYVVRHPSGL